MDHEIERHATSLGMDFEPTRLVFDLSHRSRDIFDTLALQTPPILEAFRSMQTKIPLPESAAAKVEGHFYRLPSHNRSFCYSLAQSGSLIDAPVLVFKGCEPLLKDFPAMLDWMAQAPLRKSSRVMADHFPLAEGKIPGALSLKEALHEAEIALDIQKKHLTHYRELAKIPMPLLIHSISESQRDACAAILRRKLSQSAFDRIDSLLQHGLAIYIYYYPSSPIRSNYLGDMGGPQFKQFLERRIDVNKVAADWVRLIMRLLYLGYLPYSVRNEGLGACMDFGNAALDGGFCDPDSIIAIESSMDDEFFRESVIQTFSILQNTIQRIHGVPSSPALYPSIEEFAYRQYVHHLIKAAVVSEVRPGLHLDARFLKLLAPQSIADVEACIDRKKRISTYTHFAKRQLPPHAEHRSGDGYP